MGRSAAEERVGDGGGHAGPVLPADDHVHSEWSWDAVAGDMDATCARAVELGLGAVSFTEHVDLGRGVVPPEILAHAGREPRLEVVERIAAWADEDGTMVPPPL